jgi:type I restriction enzyme S subunit
MSFQLRPLHDLCLSNIERVNPANAPDDEFWYVDISSIDSALKIISTPTKIKGKFASVRARQLIHTNDVLVSTTRPNLNAVAQVPDSYDGQIGSTGFCVLRCGNELDSDYLFHFGRSSFFINSLSSLVQGALYPAVTDKQVFAQSIPWVPIEKQRQIAARLKAQLAEVDKARQAAEAQLRETTQLADAIVFDSIRRSKTIKHNLGEVLEEIKQGIGESWADYPVLGATRAGLAPAKEPPGKKPERYKPVFPSTVFYNPMRILIGSIALVDADDPPGITSPDYVAIQGREGLIDSRWFYYWLRSPLGEQCILSLARGAVRERMLFNRLAEGEIELPSLTIQQKASSALAALKPMRQAIEGKVNEINLLPQKILAQAFVRAGHAV